MNQFMSSSNFTRKKILMLLYIVRKKTCKKHVHINRQTYSLLVGVNKENIGVDNTLSGGDVIIFGVVRNEAFIFIRLGKKCLNPHIKVRNPKTDYTHNNKIFQTHPCLEYHLNINPV